MNDENGSRQVQPGNGKGGHTRMPSLPNTIKGSIGGIAGPNGNA